MIDFLSPRLKLVNPACATLETARPATIAAVTHPFRNERIIIELPPGGSVANVMRTLGVDPTRPARVFIDDRIVTLEQRDGIFLKPGQTLTIRVVPAGGSNSKNTEILTIVVAAIAAVATYGATSALVANSAFFASATQAGGSDLLASAALAGIQGAVDESVKFLGGLAINALIPPPKTPAVRLSSTPQSYTVSGGANSAAAFSVIPKIYGARRIFPQYAASPYTELVGFDQYLRMLFLLGYGPLDISQIQIGDTAIEDYEDVEWELRAGFTDDAPSRLYPGSVVETDLSIQLSKTVQNARPSGAGTWSITQTSGPLADELSADISFPGGLVAFSSTNGSPIHIQCTWQIQWAPHGQTNWTPEPDIVIKSTNRGTTAAGHVWRVPRGQYDVQMQVTAFAINGNDWTQVYSADSFWTALRTIRDQAPYTMPGLSVLAVRIRASRQLSGVISNLNCVASSILPDYDSTTGSWYNRAGGWDYDYDNAGAGALLYSLDSANAHTTSAVTDKRFITDSVIGTGDGSTLTFSNTLPVPPPPSPIEPGDLTYSIQPGSLIVSVGTQASVTDSPGTKKKSAAVASLLFISDDGAGNIVGPTVSSGTIDYTTGAISVTFSNAPATGLDITCDFTLLVQTAGVGNALAIQTASGSDQAAVASKSIPVVIFPPDASTGQPKPTIYTVSGWYKASAALASGVTIRVFWGDSENFAAVDAIGYVDVLSGGSASTSWQQATGMVQPPSGKSAAIWMRIAVYHLAAGSESTVYFDDFSVTPAEQGVTAVNELPNPSFDFAGAITSNPASHYRDVLECRANKLAVTDSRLDLTGLQNWWIDNNTNNRNFNAILDGPSTVFDTLRKIVPFGRSSFTMRDSLYSIVEDKPQTTPIQHFTPRNSWGFKWTKGFPNLPQALKARFVNPGNNWEVDEIIVYDDNPAGGTYNATTTSLYEVLDLSDGCTDYVQAWKDARYHLAQARLRGETFEWHADIENIVCQHGDLVYLTHDVPEFGRGSGRIASVQLDGSNNCTGVTVDETDWKFVSGNSYVARFRKSSDGSSLLENLTNPAGEGTPETSALFDGSSSGIFASGPISPPAEFTLECWFKTTAGGPIFAFDEYTAGAYGNTDRWLRVVETTGLLDAWYNNGPSYHCTSTTAVNDGNWHHAAFVLSNTLGGSLYLDGQLVASNAATSAQSGYTGYWLAGYDLNYNLYYGGSNSLGGNLARLAIYTNPLSAPQIAAHYAAASDVEYDDAVLADSPYLFWKLADAVGSSNPSDSSGNGRTGNVYNAITYGEAGPFAVYFSVQTSVLTFATAIPSGNPQPEVGDLTMFGLLNSETAPLLITKIEPSHDLSARITAVDYAPDIYNADSGSPVFNSQGQAAPARPVPQIATVNSSDFFSPRGVDGSIEVRIMIALKPVSVMLPDAGSILGIEYELQTNSTQGLNDLGAYNSSTTYNAFDAVTYSGQIWVALADGIIGVTPGTNPNDWGALAAQGLNNRGAYDSSATYNISDMVEYGDQFWVAITNSVTAVTPGTNGNDWTIVTESSPWTEPAEVPATSTVIITGVEAGYSYNIRLRYTFVDGSRSNWSQVSHVVAGQTTLPNDPTNLTAKVTHKADIKLKWDAPSPQIENFKAYEIRIGGSWAAGIFVDRTKVTEYLITDPVPGSYTYWVAAMDSSGNYDANPPGVVASLNALPDVTALAATITNKNDILLTWTLATPPPGFAEFEVRSALSNVGWANAAVLHSTKQHKLLITDPQTVTIWYWVGVKDRAGNYDPTPPWVEVSFTQQAYTSKTLLSSDVGPFTSTTPILTVDYTVPPSGGRIHVDWTMLLTNGATEQNAIGYVQDDTNSLLCAQHRTHLPTSQTHGFNASGHFNKLYAGGSVVQLTLYCEPTNAKNLTVNADDDFGPFGSVSGTFLDIQFHPSPN